MSLEIIDNLTGCASRVTSWAYNNRCPNCGKPYVYVGDAPVNGWPIGTEPYCTCKSINKQNEPINYGWICPRCGKVHAPFILQCDCPVNTQVTTKI